MFFYINFYTVLENILKFQYNLVKKILYLYKQAFTCTLFQSILYHYMKETM